MLAPADEVEQRLMRSVQRARAEFDEIADDYEALHAESIRASGEDPSYFARYKRDVLVRRFRGRAVRQVLDYGCGIGTLTEHLADAFPTVRGFDPSARSVASAARRVPGAVFLADTESLEAGAHDLVVLANVLHHIDPGDRQVLIEHVASLLKPAGWVAIFEHNPLNPVTRNAVGKCPFDEGVQLLTAREVRRLVRQAHLDAPRSEFIVFFPHFAWMFRGIEPYLRWLPLGAQHVTFAQRLPAGAR